MATVTDGKFGVESPFKERDRVQRVGRPGMFGTVKMVREELETAVSGDEATKLKGLMIGVQWDNGTFSYFAVNALERV